MRKHGDTCDGVINGDRAVRCLRPVVALTVGVLLCLALVFCVRVSVALAVSSQRGHVFCETCTFGTASEGALSDPGQVAVSNTTGDVYVLDRGHDRIVQYRPNGEFLSAWGWGVKNGAWEYQTCASECHAGVAGRGEYQLNPYVISIAVDNCTTPAGAPCSKSEDPSVGDLYVLKEYAFGEHKHSRTLTEEELELAESEQLTAQHAFSEAAAIDKFSSSGEPLTKTRTIKYTENAVEGEVELEAESALGLTVAPDGTVWLSYAGELFPGEGELFALNDRKTSRAAPPLRYQLPGEREPWRGVAVDPAGGFYTGFLGRPRLPIWERDPIQIQRTGIAKWRSEGQATLTQAPLALTGEADQRPRCQRTRRPRRPG